MTHAKMLIGCTALQCLVLFAARCDARPPVVAPFHRYEVTFDGSGTYASDATGLEAAGEYFVEQHKELPFAWTSVFDVFFEDDQVPDFVEGEPSAYGSSVTVSGTLTETGLSSRTTVDAPVPYSCQGAVSTFTDGAELWIARALSPTPQFVFTVQAFHEFTCPYPGCECTGGYDAFTSTDYFGGEQEHFAATVSLDDLTSGKVIYYVESSAGALEDCTEPGYRPTCSQSLSWTGHVTFRLLADGRPPYVRPAATSLSVPANGRLPLPLAAAHPQMGPASGKVKLVAATGGRATYGSARFRIADGQETAGVTVRLNAGARRVLKKTGQLGALAVVKGKDALGTATTETPVTIQMQ